MYWEQLELRCRTLYSQPPPPPTVSTVGPLLSTPRTAPACRCCEQCHAHRTMTQTYPWDPNSPFWIPGQPTTNFYSPNPGDELVNGGNRGLRGRAPGWSWPRMPWQRGDRFRATPSSPDSQYGFSNMTNVPDPTLTSMQSANYALINASAYGVWGPPPPYSDPNSPARRSRYPYLTPMQCQQVVMPEQLQSQPVTQNTVLECHQRTSSAETADVYTMQAQHRPPKRQSIKSKNNHEHAPSDSDGMARDKVSSTLPARKSKKRQENGAKSVGPNSHPQRITAQEIFCRTQTITHEPYVQPNAPSCSSNASVVVTHSRSRRAKAGVENGAFQSVEPITSECEKNRKETAESEVYFGDVSSCCNISVQNENNEESSGSKKSPQESFTQEEVDDYLAQRFGKRDTSTRSRLPFPQIPEVYEQRSQDKTRYSVPKDQSRQSMCSAESDEKTDFTYFTSSDPSPATPASTTAPPFQEPTAANNNQHYSDAFIASYPYSSNEQSQEAHKRLTKNLQDIFHESDSPLTKINYDSDVNSYQHSSSSSSNNLSCRSPKMTSQSLTPAKRSSNLTTVVSPVGPSNSSSGVGLMNTRNTRDDTDRRL